MHFRHLLQRSRKLAAIYPLSTTEFHVCPPSLSAFSFGCSRCRYVAKTQSCLPQRQQDPVLPSQGMLQRVDVVHLPRSLRLYPTTGRFIQSQTRTLGLPLPKRTTTEGCRAMRLSQHDLHNLFTFTLYNLPISDYNRSVDCVAVVDREVGFIPQLHFKTAGSHLAPTPKMATGRSSLSPSTKSSQSSGKCFDSKRPPPPIMKALKRLTYVHRSRHRSLGKLYTRLCKLELHEQVDTSAALGRSLAFRSCGAIQRKSTT